MNPAHDPLDPQIARFAREATPEMSIAQAASILGFCEDTVKRLCRNGLLRAKAMEGARHESQAERERRESGRDNPRRNTQPKRRWTITQQALMTYIIESVRGDKTLILTAVRELCPRWLAVAEAAAKGKEPVPSAQCSVPSAAELPANVIPMRRGKSATPADPFAGHPELFSRVG
jgi:hypothetical protein